MYAERRKKNMGSPDRFQSTPWLGFGLELGFGFGFGFGLGAALGRWLVERSCRRSQTSLLRASLCSCCITVAAWLNWPGVGVGV